MTVVWILLTVLGFAAGINSLSMAFGAGGSGVVAGKRRIPYVGLVLAAALLAGMVAVAYTQGRTWMVVASWIVLGLVLVYALATRFMAPPIERVPPDELADRVQDYAEGPGPHAMSIVVQGSLVATMKGGKLTRHALLDGSCPYCFVEQCLQAVSLNEDGRGDTLVQDYRTHLRTGPNVEVHMRRPDASEPWYVEFAVPKHQPAWDSRACTTHRQG